jgi:phosphoenolpyruvate-protein kinase (PTS system EI component)
MAGDPLLAWVLLGIGLRNFSMAPRQIPIVKSVLRATRLADAERLAAAALGLRTESEIEELVYNVMYERFPLELDDDQGE